MRLAHQAADACERIIPRGDVEHRTALLSAVKAEPLVRRALFLVEFAVRVVCLDGRRGRIRPAGMPEPLLVGGYRVRSLRNSRVVSM
jgi:hypothetical protein